MYNLLTLYYLVVAGTLRHVCQEGHLRFHNQLHVVWLWTNDVQ